MTVHRIPSYLLTALLLCVAAPKLSWAQDEIEDDQAPSSSQSKPWDVSLEIKPWPADARVTLNGELLGVNEQEVKLAYGRHEVRVEREGYVTRTEVLDLAPQSARYILLRVSLSAIPTPTEQVEGRMGGVIDDLAARRTIGWIGVASGVALVGASVTFAALSGVPRDCSVMTPQPCAEANNLSGWGTLTGVLGGAALIGGLGLLTWDALAGYLPEDDADTRAAKPVKVRGAQVGLGPRGAVVRFRF